MASNEIEAATALDNTAPHWPDKTQRLYEAALVAVALAGLGFVVLLWTAV